MKKTVVLWLLPLAVMLFIGFPFNLSALSPKDEQQLTKLEDKQASGKKLSRSEEKDWADLRAQKDRELVDIAPTLNPPTSPNGSVPAVRGGSENSGPDGVPPWVTDMKLLKDKLDPDVELGLDKVYIGIGSAKNESDPLQAIRMAESRARQDIAFQYSTLVGATISDLWQNTGMGSVTQNQIVGKQSAEQLFPAKVVYREQYGNTWWVVVTLGVEPTKITGSDTEGEGINVESAMDKAIRQMEKSLERDRLKRSR